MRLQSRLDQAESELQDVIRRFEDETGMRLRLAALVDGGDEFVAVRLITVEEEKVIRGPDVGLAAAMLSGIIVDLVGESQTLEAAAARGLYVILSAATGMRRDS
jgi:hypothetical protein